jgi:hypothetical protein
MSPLFEDDRGGEMKSPLAEAGGEKLTMHQFWLSVSSRLFEKRSAGTRY